MCAIIGCAALCRGCEDSGRVVGKPSLTGLRKGCPSSEQNRVKLPCGARSRRGEKRTANQKLETNASKGLQSALLEKSEIDCVGHSLIANIVRMEMVSRRKARQQSAGMIRIA